MSARGVPLATSDFSFLRSDGVQPCVQLLRELSSFSIEARGRDALQRVLRGLGKPPVQRRDGVLARIRFRTATKREERHRLCSYSSDPAARTR